MRKKWLINVNEEPNMINATLDIGRSLRQIIIDVSLFLAFMSRCFVTKIRFLKTVENEEKMAYQCE